VYTLVRRFIKTGVIFLGIGLGIGGWLLISRELLGRWPDPYLVSAHTHSLIGGFVLFLILGVALWLFPRPDREDRRYRPGRIAAAYWLLTAGTAIRIGGELLRAWVDPPGLPWLITAAGLAQIAAVALYFWTMWHRIRPLGSRLRETQGERF
jgi:hypothetical protein